MNVLTISRNYPNEVLPHLGPWVEGLVRPLAERCHMRVVAPVPFASRWAPLPEAARRFARVPRRAVRYGVAVEHPRFLTGPGYSTHSWDAASMHRGVRPVADRLHREAPLDLIHGHFVYPDGVVAARLAARYGIPYVVTEHALWEPWMTQYPRVSRQAVPAARGAAAVLAASEALAESIRSVAGLEAPVRVVRLGVDTEVFDVGDGPRDPDRIVCVGRIQHVKGIDVLLRAFRDVLDRRPSTRLTVVGGSFYPAWQREEDELRALGVELGIDPYVTYTGPQTHAEVARHVQSAAVLVSASRRESFGTTLVEALACGTPVVATRSGGPEDIVTPDVGRLADVDDVEGLSSALAYVLDHPNRYPPARLRSIAVANYSWYRIADEVIQMYSHAVSRRSSQ